MWKPNRGSGVGEWSLGFPQPPRPGVWAKYTHCTGPAQNQQCELSISVGNKRHSGVTALHTDYIYAPNLTIKEGRITNLKIENKILLGVNLVSGVFTLHLLEHAFISAQI